MTIGVAYVQPGKRVILACDYRVTYGTAYLDDCDKAIKLGWIRGVFAGDMAQAQSAQRAIRKAEGIEHIDDVRASIVETEDYESLVALFVCGDRAWSFHSGSMLPLSPGVHTIGSAGDWVAGYLAAQRKVTRASIRKTVVACAAQDCSISARIQFV